LYYRITTEEEGWPKGTTVEGYYVDFDTDYYTREKKVTSIEEVIVDPNNCVKVFTYDNEDGEGPCDYRNDTPYIFANEGDLEHWLDVHNSGGHENIPYYQIDVVDGVETHYDFFQDE
jgi:hypothetical protein